MKRTMNPLLYFLALAVCAPAFALQAVAQTSIQVTSDPIAARQPTAQDLMAQAVPNGDPGTAEIIRATSARTPDHPVLSREALDKLWDDANTAYINADYAAAVHLYDSILATGNASYKLYYNLGNAWFKENRIGQAILYYNKALKLSPSDGDTEYNLRVANTHVKDKIEKVPEFFLNAFARNVRQSLRSDTWAALSLVLLALTLGALLVYLLSETLGRRKLGFYGGLACLLLTVFTTVCASMQREELISRSEAIVMSTAAAVKSSPDNASKDLFVLHEGTKVHIVSSLGNWREVAIADGNKGWIDATAIEVI